MTLEKSVLSSGGLPPNLTVELETSEERHAALLVQRRGLEPPIDVEALAASMATVAIKKFPLEIDGLCLDLKRSGVRPKIWISDGLHRVRRRFTLAHEIGHIRIPWHTGTIVDEVDVPHSRERGKYVEMEAEANRFAAELLMPTAWVLRCIERTHHPTDLMRLIISVADVSFDAALFRVQKLSPAGYVGAAIRDGVIAWSGRTRGTNAKPPAVGSRLDEFDTLVVEAPRELRSSTTTYLWWKVRDSVRIPGEPEEPWRETLARMLLSIPEEHRFLTQQRVNAVIGAAFSRARKAQTADELYLAALEQCQNRNDRDRWLKAIVDHPDFPSYLIARCHQQAKKRSTL